MPEGSREITGGARGRSKPRKVLAPRFVARLRVPPRPGLSTCSRFGRWPRTFPNFRAWQRLDHRERPADAMNRSPVPSLLFASIPPFTTHVLSFTSSTLRVNLPPCSIAAA